MEEVVRSRVHIIDSGPCLSYIVCAGRARQGSAGRPRVRECCMDTQPKTSPAAQSRWRGWPRAPLGGCAGRYQVTNYAAVKPRVMKYHAPRDVTRATTLHLQ